MKKVVSTIIICMIMICNLTGCTTDKINSSSNKTTIYFVRHGQTDTNVEGLMVGQSGDPQLTEDGKNNAFKLGKGLSKIKFDAAYSSDLTRAYDTAELVLKGANESLTVEKESNFNDISWGDAEGMTWEEISKNIMWLICRSVLGILTIKNLNHQLMLKVNMSFVNDLIMV